MPWVKRFVPSADSWQQLADLQHAPGRWYPGLARLADGSFLVMGGGQCCDAVRTDTAERFDLASQTWSYTGSMLNPAEFPPAALLYTGEVLITWSPPQLYNPSSGQWRFTGNLNQPNRGWPGHSDHSVVVLVDGRVLVLGVRKEAANNSFMGERYDPSTESWTLLSNPGLVRFQSEVVQLPDGRILVAGGETEASPPPVPTTLGIVKWSDLYDPSNDTWRRVADMIHFREYHAVTLLVPDGRVLTTGGTRIKFQVGPTSNDIEAFSPPYLFRGVRPEITGVTASELLRGGPLSFQIAPATQITGAVLMGVLTTTHWVDAGVPRRLVLPVSQSGTQIDATLPLDPNVLPLGYYMLFAMVDDIPSRALMVRILGGPQGPPAGRVPDGAQVAGLPLRLGKRDASQLLLDWNASCVSTDIDYEIYEGSIGAFTTHVPVTCSTGGATERTIAAGPGNRYYLVVARTATWEGSYGTNSAGDERPQGATACLPRSIAGCP